MHKESVVYYNGTTISFSTIPQFSYNRVIDMGTPPTVSKVYCKSKDTIIIPISIIK